ncbi:hypothetical protein [Pseudacidovorax intermedius]|uniref:hypothetical protein n=1 Tax=Pseudacidovorax intermedius TaxID=433924 RepID=UPI0011C02A34|nr:hypothetical protein [Pseudacidovorax intermedius]
MRHSILHVIFATFLSMSAQASGDQYAVDLAGLHGEIRQVEAMRDLCAKDFPASAAANSIAVEDWRARNAAVLGEIETRWQRLLEQKAGGSVSRREALDAWSKELYESTKKDFYIQLRRGGEDVYRARCEGFPRYLQTAQRMQLGVAFSDTLRRIRQAPK